MNRTSAEATDLATQSLLLVRDLVVRRGASTVLRVHALDVAAGETLAVIGPNGAGKSSFLLAIAQLLRPVSGEIWFGGRLVCRRWELEYRRRLGMVLQEPLLLSDTVFNNVAAGLRFRSLERAEVKKRVFAWLEKLGIAHLANRPARSLSGGEAQRVNLARAFALQADLLLLDEPFAALDPPTRSALQADFQSLLTETGQTALLVTHDLEEAWMLCDRAAVFIGGELRQVGLPDDLFAKPADTEVAAYVGVETILPGVSMGEADGLVRVALDGFQVEVVGSACPGRKVYVCVRPEDVTLWLDGGGVRSSARNQLKGSIQRIVPQGVLSKVYINCGFMVVALVTRASIRDLGLEPGMPVAASFKATAAHIIPRQ
ncbi:MAG: ABC transporter ATP-binding protein [Anaerolineaceae bacterium]|nr:ABC transporter ATP-binding protein [Anaerolineaceae bacterium]